MSRLAGVAVRWKWVLGATVLVVIALVTVAVVVNGHRSPTSAGRSTPEGSRPTVATTPSPSGARSLTSGQQAELEQSIGRMRDVVPVNAATSPQYPAVDAGARQQADLYAAAFVRQLLTQDYRTSRELLLSWVQSESAQSTDPLVVGLTPVDLRDRMAVASVQDNINGPSPVPSGKDWADLALRQGHTTVRIQRVSQPVSWASAVASGQITDPGVTARQVDAEVTVHTNDNGKATAMRYSVALVVNLEGPPVRDGYGFVAAITYNLAAVR
jgi:hypothetical protein